MAKNRAEKKHQKQKKREQKKRQGRSVFQFQNQLESAEFYFNEALWQIDAKNYDAAEKLLKRAAKADPGNRVILIEMLRVGHLTDRKELMGDAGLQLYEKNLLKNNPKDNHLLLELCIYLIDLHKVHKAMEIINKIQSGYAELLLSDRKQYRKRINEIVGYATYQVSRQTSQVQRSKVKSAHRHRKTPMAPASDPKAARAAALSGNHPDAEPAANMPGANAKISSPDTDENIPSIPITLQWNTVEFATALASARPANREDYDLALSAIRIRFKETFDHLLCLGTLRHITSLIYQEETARKILKTFRGRALLADEVGMGKTIEACMIVKEYLMRQMVKTVLILVPTPLVSYDLPWNPMRIEQRIGRIHRIGQENQVLIYNLCAAGTVEDYILEILDKKINMFEMVIGEIDMIIGRMRGEQDFSDMIYDIWVNSSSQQDRQASFNHLGAQLKRCKTGYEKTRSLDEKLFGENYEI